MSRTFGRYGPTFPLLGQLASGLSYAAIRNHFSLLHFHDARSPFARARATSLRNKLRAGATTYLLGIGPASHNAGVALVEVSCEGGARLICNNEEERFAAVKNCAEYPRLSIDALCGEMARRGIRASDIHACVAAWDYAALTRLLLRTTFEELPHSVTYLWPEAFPALELKHLVDASLGPARLGRQLGLDGPMPIIGLRHHHNHAYFAYALSPFARSDEPVMVTVLDGSGDDGAISLYVGRRGRLSLHRSNPNIFDSLGLFYSFISSTQGGWTILSSEGRYMGAAAWGDGDRLTNPYYKQLRQIFYFAPDGGVYLNRDMANWHRGLLFEPYGPALQEILGPPISRDRMWNPDAILDVEDTRHADVTRERVDKAAATQLVFEDAISHIVDHLIRSTGSNKLVLSGGTALNGVASMRLLEHFGEAYYTRHLGRTATRLHVWAPPAPGDAGAAAGAAYYFALGNGVPPGEPMRHAFYCGRGPRTPEIVQAVRDTPGVGSLRLGSTTDQQRRAALADLVAYIVASDGVVGIVQGPAETGPRALGHRSILANPCNPAARDVLNRLVKFREAIRPLAPMVTRADAPRWFVLEQGASDDDYNTYNYMVLTARVRPETRKVIPAVVHIDDTARIQIVRAATDPFMHAYLEAMGRRVGAEVSINTSLNVGGPIVQTAHQAVAVLKRSRALDGIFLLSEEGDAWVVWDATVAPPKDGGARLHRWLAAWQTETGIHLG